MKNKNYEKSLANYLNKKSFENSNLKSKKKTIIEQILIDIENDIKLKENSTFKLV